MNSWDLDNLHREEIKRRLRELFENPDTDEEKRAAADDYEKLVNNFLKRRKRERKNAVSAFKTKNKS
jgi:hypothetical protein